MVLTTLHVFLDVPPCRLVNIYTPKRFCCCERGLRSLAFRFITICRALKLGPILSQRILVLWLTFCLLSRYCILTHVSNVRACLLFRHSISVFYAFISSAKALHRKDKPLKANHKFCLQTDLKLIAYIFKSSQENTGNTM